MAEPNQDLPAEPTGSWEWFATPSEPPAGRLPSSPFDPATTPFTILPSPRLPLPLADRLRLHHQVIRETRLLLQRAGFLEVVVPRLMRAAGSGGADEIPLGLDPGSASAFLLQSGQLDLAELVALGMKAVYCEGARLLGERTARGCHLIESRLFELESRDLNLAQLCAFQESFLKDLARGLHVDLIGGANVTRLDRILEIDLPRLTYREALQVLERRGLDLGFGDALDGEAGASLCRYGGGLPVQVTHHPECLRSLDTKVDRSDPQVVESVDTILPYAGETLSGAVHECDGDILRRRVNQRVLSARVRERAQALAHWRRAAGSSSTNGEPAGPSEEALAQAILALCERTIALRAGQPAGQAGCRLDLARLLQFLMGLDSLEDCVIFLPPGARPAEARSMAAASD